MNGSNFVSAAIVQVNGVNCTTTTHVSSSQLICVVPTNGDGASAIEQVNVTVQNDVSDTATLKSAYTYLGSPSMWLDASQLPAVATGTSINTWTDESGNGNSPTNGPHSPTYNANAQNGLPSIKFNGNNQYLSHNTGFPTTTDYTITLVVKQTSTKNQGNMFSDGSNSQHALYYAGGNKPILSNNGTDYLSSSVVTNLTSFYTITATRVNATRAAAMFVNGANAGTGTDPAANTSSQFQIGADSGKGYLGGEITEVFLYGTLALSSTQRTALESYLRTKYQHY